MSGRAARLRAATVAMAAGLLLAATHGVVPVSAAEPDFGTPTMTSSFEDGLRVTQPVTLTEAPARVELLLRYADASAPLVIPVELPAREFAAIDELRYTAVEADGHLLPNTPVEARWRITPTGGGDPVIGPSVDGVYVDDRFDWQTLEGEIVRVHWYEGDRAFGERALAIGEDAVASTAALLGVTEDEPVDFFIYADQGAFYDALGPGTRENVGGQANADIRTLFALITPREIGAAWVGIVIPHELVHLVFDTAVSNPYHFPPRWLNEGLATYLSQGYDASDRAAVEAAARDGTLIPLSGIAGQFPTSAQRFYQAYAQSVSAVDFFIRTHGEDALVSLVRSYADGRTDDEAFEAAIGMGIEAFDAAWMADLDAVAPTRHGPLPAPDGPEPAAWASDAPGAATAPPSPDAGASAAPPGSAPPDDTGGAGGTGSGGGPGLLVVLAIGGALAAILVVAWMAARRRRDRIVTEP